MPPTYSLYTQLKSTLTSFECSNDIASKQDACVLFTMQLIYGTLHAIPLEQWRNSMQLCINYFQISSTHKANILNWLTEAPEEQQQCTELLKHCNDNWTKHAKTVLSTTREQLAKADAVTFDDKLYATTIPALLENSNKDKKIRQAAEYISYTLVDLTTINDENRNIAERVLIGNVKTVDDGNEATTKRVAQLNRAEDEKLGQHKMQV